MKNQLNFSASELSATITLSVLILLMITYQLWVSWGPSNLESSKTFLSAVNLFQKSRFYSDSILTTREEDTIKNKMKTAKKIAYQIVKVDLNHCDTTDIKSIPMFGSARARKVVEYRDQLGGFHSVEQLREIYILKELEIEFLDRYFVVQKSDYKKIRINSITYEELKRHPYFDAYLAKQVLRYREKSGPIRSMEDLQIATKAYSVLIEKMRPYISFE